MLTDLKKSKNTIKYTVYAWRIFKVVAMLLLLWVALMIWPTVIAGGIGGWNWVIFVHALFIGSVIGAFVLMGIGWVIANIIERMNKLEKDYVKETNDEKFSVDLERC